MEDNLFNFILSLYVGFFVIYVVHPVPKILHKRVFLNECTQKTSTEMCVH